MAEEKTGSERRYAKREERDSGEKRGDGEGGHKEMEGRHADERETEFRTQRRERMDLHGQHRGEHDALHKRQMERMEAMNRRHMSEMGGDQPMAAENASAEPGEGGGAGPA